MLQLRVNKLLEKSNVKMNSFMILIMFFFNDLWYVFFYGFEKPHFSFMIFFNVFFYDLWYVFFYDFFMIFFYDFFTIFLNDFLFLCFLYFFLIFFPFSFYFQKNLNS